MFFYFSLNHLATTQIYFEIPSGVPPGTTAFDFAPWKKARRYQKQQLGGGSAFLLIRKKCNHSKLSTVGAPVSLRHPLSSN